MFTQYGELKRLMQRHPREAALEVCGAIREGVYKPEEFSIAELFEATVPDGSEAIKLFNPRQPGGYVPLREDAGNINTAQFANITGQIVYTKIMEASVMEDNVFSKIIPMIPTRLSGEKIAGISQLGDQAGVVGEGQSFPRAGVSEDYIETPVTTKRGFIVGVTKEAIFFDRTNLVLSRAAEVGAFLAINKEKRLIDCVIDENTTKHRYKWRGNVIATYGDNSGTHSWDNLEASNALADWTDINAAEQLLANMLDPNTGEPIVVNGTTLIVTPQLAATAAYIRNQTFGVHFNGYSTSGTLMSLQAPSPIGSHQYSASFPNVITSRQLAARLGTDTTWFYGDPSKAFAYMENWPITVTQSLPGGPDEFERDVVNQFKASEMGAASTMQPRAMVKCTA